MDVAFFVREIVETNPKLREAIMARLLDTFYQIRASRVATCALWIIGEYCLSLSEVQQALATVRQSLGDLPFFTSTAADADGDSDSKSGAPGGVAGPPPPSAASISSKRPAVLADGTYASQSAASEAVAVPAAAIVAGAGSAANLRALLLAGDFFLGAVAATTLTKLILRLEQLEHDKTAVNAVRGQQCTFS